MATGAPKAGYSSLVSSTGGEDPNPNKEKGKIVGASASDQKPETTDSKGEKPRAEKSNRVVLHLAQALRAPQQLPEIDGVGGISPEQFGGATYLSAQQANRRNNPDPKPIDPFVFSHASARDPMNEVKTAFQPIPEPQGPTRSLFLTLRDADNQLVNQVNWQDVQRIYIPGLGEAGDGRILQGTTVLTARELAQSLRDQGIVPTVRDIRITSAGSADAAPEQPDDYGDSAISVFLTQPLKGVGQLLGDAFKAADKWASRHSGTEVTSLVGGAPASTQPFAQQLSQALSELGINGIRVHGYHGVDVPRLDYLRQHHLRELPPAQQEGAAAAVRPNYVRRSTVRECYVDGVLQPRAPAIRFPPPNNDNGPQG